MKTPICHQGTACIVHGSRSDPAKPNVCRTGILPAELHESVRLNSEPGHCTSSVLPKARRNSAGCSEGRATDLPSPEQGAEAGSLQGLFQLRGSVVCRFFDVYENSHGFFSRKTSASFRSSSLPHIFGPTEEYVRRIYARLHPHSHRQHTAHL